jgi:hypothetical protein
MYAPKGAAGHAASGQAPGVPADAVHGLLDGGVLTLIVISLRLFPQR